MAHISFDPYQVLGVTSTASPTQITRAYRSRLRTLHPDTRAVPASPDSDDSLQQVIAAYDILRDAARRAEYDRRAADYAERRRARAESRIHNRRGGPIRIPVTYRAR